MALGSRLKNWSVNEVLTEPDLEAEFDNCYNSLIPSVIDDDSTDVASMQATADPGELASESLATSLQGEIQRLRYVIAQIKGDSYWYGTDSMTLGGVPVGSIIPWYDFDAAVSLPSNYLYCDGSAISDATSILDGETLPDLSGRYLVGFGTPNGGGDIDSAAWATAAVGNTSHESDISHVHTMGTHEHTMGTHAHTFIHTHELNHTHTMGFTMGTTPAVTGRPWSNTSGNGAGWYCASSAAPASGGANDATTDSQSTNNTGQTDPGDTSTVDPGDTNSGGSSTQDIQPESIRVRYIIRIK